MVNQIDKWNARYGKRKTKKGELSMEKSDWNEQLKASEEYKKATELGIDLSDVTVENEESFNEKLEAIKVAIKKTEENTSGGNSGTPSEEKAETERADVVVEDYNKEEEKNAEHIEDEAKEADPSTPAGEEKTETERANVVVEDYNKEEENNKDLDWIKQKREFYEKFSHEQNLDFKNDLKKDVESKSFTFSLEKDGKSLGEMTYNSPTSVQISKDSELPMYQGLIKDALENNLSITFGKSLDDKQKALLLAAVLMSEQKTYANGDGIELKNAPQIDINAEYFKTLPQDVQAVLKQHVEKQNQQEAAKKEAEEKAKKQAEINNKLNEVKNRLNTNKKADGTEMSVDERYALRQEQMAIMLDGKTDEQKIARQKKLEDREKINAARLGLIPEHTTVGKDGKPVTIKEDQETKDLIQKSNPEYYSKLQAKYSGRS